MIAAGLVGPDGGTDIHVSIDGAAGVVVAAVDAAGDFGAGVVVHVGFIHVARVALVFTVGAAENVVGGDGGTRRNVDHGAAGDAFVVASAIDVLNLSAEEVDDGRSQVRLGCHVGGVEFHAHSSEGSGAENGRVLELRHVLRDVDEDVAAFLHHVAVDHVVLSLAGAKDLGYRVQLIVAADRLEIDEGVAQTGLGERADVVALGIAVLAVLGIGIVVVTIGTAEDVDDVALRVFDVGRCLDGRRRMVYAGADAFSHTAGEVAVGTVCSLDRLAQDLAADVVAAVDMVAHVGEAGDGAAVLVDTHAHIGLGMSEDVGNTGPGEGVEQTAVAQVDAGVACDGGLEAAAVDEHRLRYVVIDIAGDVIFIIHVDVGAEARIVEVVLAVELIVIGSDSS